MSHGYSDGKTINPSSNRSGFSILHSSTLGNGVETPKIVPAMSFHTLDLKRKFASLESIHRHSSAECRLQRNHVQGTS